MTSKPPVSDDPLQKKIDRLIARGEQDAGKAASQPAPKGALEEAPGIREGLEALGFMARFFKRAGQMGMYAWNGVGKPLWNIVSPVVGWIGKAYMDNVWNRFAYKDNDEGERIFSKKRASAVIGLTAAFAVAAAPVLGAAAEGVVMGTTMRTETVRLYYPNGHDDGSYSVRGCKIDAEECSPSDTVYYNVRPSLARDIWSIATHGTRYLPRKVVGPINFDADNVCTVQIYDAPFEWLWQQFDSYPELLDMTCSTTSGQLQGERAAQADVSTPAVAAVRANVAAPAAAPAGP